MAIKILLVEDDIIVGESMKQRLELDKYVVDWAKDGVMAETALLNFEYDVVIMDVNLPRKSGIDVIKSLRSKDCHTPILVLTANDKTEDCVEGLASGADDYLVKPFEYKEINERLKALVRRDRRAFNQQLTYKALTLDTRRHEVIFNGQPLDVSPREYAILEMLIADPTKTVSRHKLMDTQYSWDDSLANANNALDVHIHNLRKKLGKEYIKTIRGTGYRMA